MPKSPPIGRKATAEHSRKAKTPEVKIGNESDKRANKSVVGDKSVDFDTNHYDETFFPYHFDWVGTMDLFRIRTIPVKIRSGRDLERIVNFRSAIPRGCKETGSKVSCPIFPSNRIPRRKRMEI